MDLSFEFEEPRQMSILNAYRSGKITQEVYQKYVKDGFNVKTTLIPI
jgi:hypothetical protein